MNFHPNVLFITRNKAPVKYSYTVHGQFSPDTPASSTTKTGCHNIAESGVKTQKINH
jgi:hypothetical protein